LTLGSPAAAVVTILDNDAAGTVQFTSPRYAVGETAGSATLGVTRTGGGACGVTVDYAAAGGTATAPGDFASVSGTLTFGAGETAKTLTVPIVPDTRAEGPETVVLSLTNPQGGGALGARRTAVLTIADDDVAGVLQFDQSVYRASEASATAVSTVTRTGGGAGDVSVDWTITGGMAVLGTDFRTPDGAAAGTLAFGPGVTARAIRLTLLRQGDTLADGARTIELTLSAPEPAGLAALGSRTTAVLALTDNDVGGTVQFAPAVVGVTEAAGTATLTVTRGQGAAGGVSVDWAVIGGSAIHGAPDDPAADYTGATSGTLTFGPGIASQPIPIALVDRAGAQGSRSVLVALYHPTGGARLGSARVAVLAILDDEVGLRFSQPTYAASEASAVRTITVVRTGPTAPAITVGYATGPPASGVPAIPSPGPSRCTPGADYRPVSGTLSFGPGQTSQSFVVPLCPDFRVDGAKAIGLVLSAPSAPAFLLPGRDTAVLTVADSDAGG